MPEKLVQSIRTVRGVVTETEFGRASCSWISCTIPALLPACGDPARDLGRGSLITENYPFCGSIGVSIRRRTAGPYGFIDRHPGLQ